LSFQLCPWPSLIKPTGGLPSESKNEMVFALSIGLLLSSFAPQEDVANKNAGATPSNATELTTFQIFINNLYHKMFFLFFCLATIQKRLKHHNKKRK
jgi:hypothetical protein